MARGVKTGGRKKGSLNKTTRAVRDVIAEAADSLGGVERLVSWAREDALNERAFWSTIYPKLLPLQLTGDPENPVEHNHRVRAGDLSDDDLARIAASRGK